MSTKHVTTAYYGDATWEQGLCSLCSDFTHLGNWFCCFCYPNTLAQITKKTGTKICGSVDHQQVRIYLWVLFCTAIVLDLFARILLSSVLQSLGVLIVIIYAVAITYTVYELHKSISEQQQLLPTCFANDHLVLACCCTECAVNQLAHQVDIDPYAFAEFRSTNDSNPYSSVSSMMPPSHIGMKRDTEEIYQPPVSIEETAVVDVNESTIPTTDDDNDDDDMDIDNTDDKVVKDEDIL